MPPLRYLADSKEEEDYCDKLRTYGIRDCADLLVKTDLSDLSRVTNVPVKLMMHWQKKMETLFAREAVSFGERARQLALYDKHCTTGCHAVDRFLSGGIRGGVITQITGSEGCGKSQLCYSIAADEMLKGNRVMFIDTEATFCAERVTAILRNKTSGSVMPLMDLMDVVLISEIHELFSLLDMLQMQQEAAKSANEPFKYSILILDSIRAIVTPHMTRLEQQGEHDEQFSILKELIRFMNALRHTNPSLVILVTNTRLEWFNKMWKNACAITILLKEKAVLSSGETESEAAANAMQTGGGDGDVALVAEKQTVVRQLEIIRFNELTVYSDPCFEVVITDCGFSDYPPHQLDDKKPLIVKRERNDDQE